MKSRATHCSTIFGLSFIAHSDQSPYGTAERQRSATTALGTRGSFAAEVPSVVVGCSALLALFIGWRFGVCLLKSCKKHNEIFKGMFGLRLQLWPRSSVMIEKRMIPFRDLARHREQRLADITRERGVFFAQEFETKPVIRFGPRQLFSQRSICGKSLDYELHKPLENRVADNPNVVRPTRD